MRLHWGWRKVIGTSSAHTPEPPWSLRRGHRLGAVVCVGALAVSLVEGPLLVFSTGTGTAVAQPPSTLTAAPVTCGTPGKDGPGGTLTGVVNTYYPGAAGAAVNATSISVGSPTGSATVIAAGDLLLVIQMQSALINAGNTSSYGDGVAGDPASGYTSLNGAGTYEYVTATGPVAAGSVPIAGSGSTGGLLHGYATAVTDGATHGHQDFQVIRVPQYSSATLSSGLTASAWNGATGGVLAIDVAGATTLGGTVSVSNLGFRGAAGYQQSGDASGTLTGTDDRQRSGLGAHGEKGEGIAGTPDNVWDSVGAAVVPTAQPSDGYPGGSVARGAPATAGGGGTDPHPSANDQNSGGGGGGNGGTGGRGGNSWSTDQVEGGFGGVPYPASATALTLGGGGGAGSRNNSPAITGASSGGTGGGMVLLRSGSVTGTGAITANGGTGPAPDNDGGGGGGAGGTVVVESASGSLSGLTVSAAGGAGANAWASQAAGTGNANAHGPGGGGAGGVVITSSAPGVTGVAGGSNGTTTTSALAYGATAGTGGTAQTAAITTSPGVQAGAQCLPSVTATKSPATQTVVQQTTGTTATFTTTLANAAGQGTMLNAQLSDPLPAGFTYASTGSVALSGGATRPSTASPTVGATAPVFGSFTIPGGGSVAVTFTAAIASSVSAGTYTNTVTGVYSDPARTVSGGTLTSPSNQVQVVVTAPDLTLTKTHSGAFTVGQPGSYTLTATNSGNAPTAGTVTVADTLPAGLTPTAVTGTGWACSLAAPTVTCTRSDVLAAAGSYPGVTVTVTVAAGAAPSVTNTASVSGGGEVDTANDSATDPTVVQPAADVAITKTHSGSFTVGVNGTYTLAVTDNGPSSSGALTVTDTLPTGLGFISGVGTNWSCSASGQAVTCVNASGLPSGGSSSITLVVSVASAAQPSVTNTASVAATATDPVPGNNTATDPTTVGASADVSIVKSHSGSFTVGVNGVFTVAVANAGPSPSGALTVTDTLPAGLGFVSGSGSGWSCSASGQVVTCSNAAGLASGGNSPITLTVSVGPAAAPSTTNSASVASTTADPSSANNTSSNPVTVGTSADVSIVKSHGGAFTAGQNGTYTLAVANAGPSPSGALTVSDTLPSGLTFVSATGSGWSCGASGQAVTCTASAGLASGAGSSITLVVAVGQAAVPAVTNTAGVTGTAADPVPANNTSSNPTTVNPSADLSITKTHTGTLTVGSNATYTLAVANAGPSASGALTVNDTLPSSLTFVSGTGTGWSCSATGQAVTCSNGAGLGSGGNASITLTVAVGAGAAGGVTNTASVAGSVGDPNSANNASTDSTTAPSADVSIATTHSGTFTVGGTAGYTLAVANAGPSASGALTVSDALPAGLTFVSGSGTGWSCAASGQTVTCTSAGGLAAGANTSISLSVLVGTAAQPSVTNTASVSSAIFDPAPANNTAGDTVAVGTSADVSIAKTHTGAFTVGVNGTFSLAVANAGPSPSGSVTVTDTLPTGLGFVGGTGTGWSCSASGQVVSCGNAAGLSSGGTSTITLVVSVAQAAAPSTTNTAAETSATADPNGANNSSSDTVTVNDSADVSIVKSHSGSFSAGQNGTYTLAVANAGPSPSQALTVTDTLPAGLGFVSGTGTGWSCSATGQTVTCTRAAGLAAGATGSIALVVSVGAAAVPGVTNAAGVTAVSSDPDTTNNTSSDPTTVTGSADVSIVKSHGGAFTAGQNGVYTLAVANAGPSPSGALTVTDSLPTGLTFVSGSGTGWTCSATGQTVTCSNPTGLASGSGGAITLTVAVGAGGVPAVTNSASLTSATADPSGANNTSTDPTTVNPSADVSIVKTHSGSFTVGTNGTYTLAVANAGPSPSGALTAGDTLPAGLAFVSATGTSWSCAASGQTVTCTNAVGIAAGAGSAISVVVAVGAAAAPGVSNTATVVPAAGDPNMANNSSTDPTTVTPSADVSIVKSHAGAFTVGGSGTYTLAVANAGPNPSGTLTVSDALPAGLTFVSGTGGGWSCSAASQTVTCTAAAGLTGGGSSSISLVVSAGAAAAPSVTNSATVSAAASDPNPANNSSSDPTVVTAQADVSVSKTHAGSFTAGQNGSYSLVVANNGPNSSGALTVSDTLPAGLGFVSGTGAGWSCSAASQAVTCTDAAGLGATASSTVTLTVSVGAAAAPSVTNTASVSAATADPDSANNSSSDPTTVNPSADLSIVKTHTGTFTAGANATYTLAVANAGPSPSGALTVTDTLPSSLAFVAGSGPGWSCSASAQAVTCANPAGLASGGSSTITLTVTVAAGTTGSVVNTAAVAGPAGDPNPANNSSTDTVSTNQSADVSIIKSHAGSFTVGVNGTYLLAVQNAGPSPSGALTVTDTLPAGLSFVSGGGAGWSCGATGQAVTCTSVTGLAPGGSGSISLVVSVAAGAVPGVTNTATVTAATSDPSSANNSSSDPTTVNPSADLSIVKSHAGSFSVGTNGTYTLAVANAGPMSSGALTVSDTLPAGMSFVSGTGTGWSCSAGGQAVTCTDVAGLAAGGGSGITLTVSVGPAAAPSVTNTATVTGTANDVNPGNNTSSDTAAVTPVADVSIVKTHTGTFSVGQNGTYTLAVANAGPSPSGALTVTDTLPAGLGFVSGSGAGWSCSASGQTVTCSDPSGLGASAASSIALVVSVSSATAASVSNTAGVAGTAADPAPANNTSSDPTTVSPSADVSITKSHTGVFTVGQNGTYTLSVADAGPSATGALSVTDTLPAGLGYVSAGGGGFTCSAAAQTVTCTDPTGLASGGATAVTLTVAVGAGAVPSVTNTATVSEAAGDPNTANNSSADPTTISPAADVSILKSHTGSFTAGQNGTYTLAVANAGPSASGTLTVTDTLPGGLGFVSGTGGGWSCSASGQAVTCTSAGGLASGASSSIALVVSVSAGAVPGVTNSASVSGTASDPNPGNNLASDPTTVRPSADLSIAKAHTGGVVAGTPATYTLSVANAGPSASGGITVSDVLPPTLTYTGASGTGFTCSAGGQTVTCTSAAGLPSGGRSVITLGVAVSSGASGTVDNTATVTGSVGDPTPANNSSTDTAVVGEQADVSIVKSHSGSFTVGQNGLYTLSVANAGPSPTGGLTVTDTLPAGLGFVSASGGGFSCTAAGQTVTCTNATGLGSTGAASISLVVSVAPGAAPSVTNTAAVTEAAGDPDTGNNTSDDPTTVTPSADVSIVKSHTGSFTVGINGSYSLAVSNAGPSATGALTVSDTLPPGLSFVSGGGAGWTCAAAGQAITCTNPGGLNSGGSSVVVVTVGVGDAATPSVTNTATVVGSAADPVGANNSSSDPTTVVPSADLQLQKSHTGTFIAGTNGVYTLTVGNAGPSASGAITLTDTLPAGLSFVSGTGGGFTCSAAGQTVTCSSPTGLPDNGSAAVTLTVAVGAAAVSVTNTAAVSGAAFDPDTTNNSASDVTSPIIPSADVSIVKTHVGAVTAGADATYSLAVSNAGPSLSGALTVTDTLPAELGFVSGSGGNFSCSASGQAVTCSDATGLAAGTSETVTLIVAVDPAAPATVQNTATVTGAAGDPNSANNTSTDSVTTGQSADVSIAKSHSGAFSVGGQGQYTLTVANAGPSATGSLTITDALPAGLTFVSGVGGNATCSATGSTVTCVDPTGLGGSGNPSEVITLTVAVGPAAAPSVTNTASVAETASDPDPTNNQSSDPTTVTPVADLSITKSHSGNFSVGQNGTYTVSVSNAGPSPSGAVTVTDTLPAGLTLVSAGDSTWSCSATAQTVTCTNPSGLASGARSSIVVVVAVAPEAAPSVTNSATVSATSTDPNPANDTAGDPTAVVPVADVSISKSHIGAFVAGTNSTYTLGLANAGPSATGALSVTDTLPAGLGFVSAASAGWSCSAAGQGVTCSNPTGLASGGTDSIILTVSVGAAAVPSVTNTASVTEAASDPNSANNTASDPTAVQPSADLSLIKTHVGVVTAGDSVTYHLAVSNAGPSVSGALTVTDTLPTGLTFVSSSGAGWACTSSGQMVTCTDATGLGVNASTAVTVIAAVSSGTTGTVINTATVTGAAGDPNPADNTSTDTATVGQNADVGIVKSHVGDFTAGQNGTYNLAIGNAGPSPTGALTVSDSLPAGLTFVSGVGSGWSCNATGQAVTCTDPAGLASGAAIAITLTVQVGFAAAPGVTNTATVSEAASDPNTANNSSSDPTTVTAVADVSIAKSHTGTFTVGVNGTYTLTVANAGPSTTGALTVADTLPPGLGLVGATGSGWTCGSAGTTVTCTSAGLGSGASSAITVVVSVSPAAAPSVTNSASVAEAATDPNPGNNSSSDPTAVAASADLSITKTHSGNFSVGVNGTYTVTVANAGPSASGALSVVDTLPTGLGFVSGTGPGWSCSAGGQTVTCAGAAGLASGASSTITLTVSVDPTAAPGVTNVVTVSGTAGDPNPGDNTASDATAVDAVADVGISLSHSGTFVVGRNGSFQLGVVNAGPSSTGSLTITDILPSGLTFLSGGAGGWNCGAAGQTVTCILAAGLASGGSSSLPLVVAVGASAAPSVTDTVSIAEQAGDPNPANNTSTDTVAVTPAADVSIVKAHSGSFTVGVNGTYTLTLANAGPSDSGAMTVTDTLPAGLTEVSASGAGFSCAPSGQTITCTSPAGLAAGATSTVSVLVAVGPSAAPGVTNSAAVSVAASDPNPSNNLSSDPTTVSPSADVSIVKTHAGTLTVGQNATYTLAVSNAGPSTSGALTVSDTLPGPLAYIGGSGTGWSCAASGQTVTCSDPAGLAAATAGTITLTVGVGPGAASGVSNTATVAGSVSDPNTANNSSTDVATAPSADLGILKSHTGSFTAGQSGTYTLTVTNAGPSASGSTTVTDALPSGLSFISGSGPGWSCSAGGQTVTCASPAGLPPASGSTITLVVGVANAAVPSVTNTVTVAGTTFDPAQANNAAADPTTVNPAADLGILKSHAGGFTAGQGGSYTLTITNSGPSASGAVTVTDTLPAGLSFVSGTGGGFTCSATGQTVTCADAAGLAASATAAITLTVLAGDAAVPSVTNTASVSGSVLDPDPANNTASDPTAVAPSADVSITKTHTGTFTAGLPGSYTLAVANAGPSASGSLTVTDTLPAALAFGAATGTGWSCSVAGQTITCTAPGGLASGQASVVTVTVIPGAAAVPGVTNTASVTASVGDPDPSNNLSSDATAVVPSADVSVVVTHTGTFVAGAPAGYHLAIANGGPSRSGQLIVTDTLPAGLTFVSGSGTGFACTASGQTVTCTRAGGLASGASGAITLDVLVAPTATGTLTDQAQVTAAVSDPNPGNNQSTDNVAIGQTADLSLVKSHTGSFQVGQNAEFILTVSSAGPSPSGPLTVTDALPAGLAFVGATGTGWTCSAAGATVTCGDPTGITAGASTAITLTVGVGPAAAPSVTNSATVQGAAGDPSQADNTGTDTATVTPTADISMVKSHSGSFAVGSNGTYTLTVSNAGPSPSGALTVGDTLPSGLTFLSGSGAGWGCTAAGQTVTCTLPQGVPAAGGSVVTLVVAVGPAAAPSVTNTATVVATATDPDPSNNASIDPTTVTPTADVSIATLHNGTFVVGQTGSFTLTVANAGPSATGPLTVTDTLPAGLTPAGAAGSGFTCSSSGATVTCGDPAGLTPGASTTITLSVAIGPAAVPSVTDTASVGESATDPALANNSSSDTVPVTPAADLSLSKSHSGSFTAGQNGSFSLTVANAGPSSSGAVTISDPLPTGLTYVSGTGIGWNCSAAAQTVTCTNPTGLIGASTSTVTLVVAAGAAAVPAVTNTASVAGTSSDPDPSNNAASDTAAVNPAADVSLVKTHVGVVTAGADATYSLAVANAGPSPSGALTLTDALPASLTFVRGGAAGWTCATAAQFVTCTGAAGLAAGGTVTVTVVVTVSPAASGAIVNTASVTGTAVDPDTSNNTSTDTAVVGQSADVGIVKTHTGSFTVGVNGTYSLTVSDAGPSPTGALTVSDNLPAGLGFVGGAGTNWTCAASGQVVTCTNPVGLDPGGSTGIALTVAVAPSAAPSVTNAASVAEVAGDPNTADNTSTDPTTVIPSADMSITKVHSGSFTAGGQGVYTLTVANAGPSGSGAITVSDPLPVGLSFVGATGAGFTCAADPSQVVTCGAPAGLAAGQTSTITLTVAVGASAVPTVTNAASVRAPASDPDQSNNLAADRTTVLASADVSIVKTHVGSVVAGSSIEYSMAVANAGPSASGALTITDNLPTGLSFLGATGTGWTCTGAGPVVTCVAAGGLPSGGSSTVAVVVSAAGSVGATIVNTASVQGSVPDPNPANNSSTDAAVTNTVADVSIITTHAGSLVVGRNSVYTLAVADAGPSSTGALTVTDTLPPGLGFVAAAGPGWSCSATGQAVSCSDPSGLASGQSSAIAVTVTVGPAAVPTVTDTAGVAEAASDPDANNNTSSDSAPVGAVDLSLVKTPAGTFTAGGQATYTLSITNLGTAATFAPVTVTDTLPGMLTFISASGTGWTCGATGRVVTCTDTTALAPADITAITLVVGIAAGAAGPISNTASVTTLGDVNALNNVGTAGSTINRTTTTTYVPGGGIQYISTPRSGAGLLGALTLGMPMMLGGWWLLLLARRRNPRE